MRKFVSVLNGPWIHLRVGEFNCKQISILQILYGNDLFIAILFATMRGKCVDLFGTRLLLVHILIVFEDNFIDRFINALGNIY